jgi:hypothetical protein
MELIDWGKVVQSIVGGVVVVSVAWACIIVGFSLFRSRRSWVQDSPHPAPKQDSDEHRAPD